jgi:hypothetical protein
MFDALVGVLLVAIPAVVRNVWHDNFVFVLVDGVDSNENMGC